MAEAALDFDGDAKKLARNAYDIAYEHQSGRDSQCERDYQNFHAYMDMSTRDSTRANVTVPKIHNIIMTKVPRDVRAVLSRRPYIPFTSARLEFKEQARLQERFLDALLYRAGFYNEFVLAIMLKTLFGTAFMECIPFFNETMDRYLHPVTIPAYPQPRVIGHEVRERPVHKLAFRVRAYAPWEIKVDPYAVGLEQPEACRYIVKIGLMSKRQLKKDAVAGKYGAKFDADKLDSAKPDYGETGKHRGMEILENMGITEPREDGDIGVMFTYESPERQIMLWNDREVIRDIPNPYPHKMINMSRLIHCVDPHTQNRFFGNGEAKINEILQSMLNDILNLALDNHNFLNQGKTYYDKGTGVSSQQLVHAVGNKIGLALQPGQSIKDVVMEDRGESLPRDHYALRQVIEDYMDLTSGSYEVMRGERVSGDHTLGEIAMLREAGDSRQELLVRSIESPFLTDFGHKCLSHIRWLAKADDYEDVLGAEAAGQLLFDHPEDIPGGWDFMFKGADKVVNQVIKQRNLAEVSDRLKDNPFLKPRGWATVLLDVHDLTDKIDDLLYTEEEVQQMQQQQFEQQLALGQREEQDEFNKQVQLADVKSQLKMSENAAKESAQEAGRAYSPTKS